MVRQCREVPILGKARCSWAGKATGREVNQGKALITPMSGDGIMKLCAEEMKVSYREGTNDLKIRLVSLIIW